MKKLIHFFVLVILFSCNSTPLIKNFKEARLGGENIHGELYQKKYFDPSDTKIHYNTWTGYEVSNNKELEGLYELYPKCEAIRFSFWDHDTSKNFELSPVIGRFKHLKFLEVHSNRITKYPKSIEKLVGLEELVLQIGQKKEIEFEFSNFTKLKHLTIHFADDLLVFPYTIFDCKDLETLKLFRFFRVENNVLNGLENLAKLRELYIWDSDLIIPDSGFNFIQMETLIVDRNRTKLPKYFWGLQTMKRFALCSMFDTLNLDDVSKMKNLETLTLSYQKHFKGKLNLPKLEHLKITEYRDKVIDIGIDKLPCLESLVVWGCSYIEGLNDISNKNLRSITINSNDKLKYVEFDLNMLRKIEEVEMRYNDSLKIDNKIVQALNIKMD